MKTQDYLILGIAAFLAYKMVQKDINNAVENLTPDMPSFDFSNFFGNMQFPSIEAPNFSNLFAGLNLGGNTYSGGNSMGEGTFTGKTTPSAPELRINNAWGEGVGVFRTEIMPGQTFTLEDYKQAGARGMLPTTPAQLTQRWNAAMFPSVASAPMDLQALGVQYPSGFAPIEAFITQKSSDASATGSAAQARAAYVAARTHLGIPIGTPAIQPITYQPNSVLAVNGGVVRTDSAGYIVSDTRGIVNTQTNIAATGGWTAASVEAARQEELRKMGRHD